tara:strand:- start:37 stop:159 length:123 start_codon:yes stop_codon:yes gene_type:complete
MRILTTVAYSYPLVYYKSIKIRMGKIPVVAFFGNGIVKSE